MPDCNAQPFSRHYDLERHFGLIHRDKPGQKNCDYSKCPNTTRFRKDHCREHYREYHNEDLLKRSKPSTEKDRKGKDKKNSKRSQDKPETVEEFLATHRHMDLSWWRCSKCVARVKVNTDEYTCPRCNLPCEPKRVAWRKKAITSAKSLSCGECENTWLTDENNDMTLWIPCAICRPGVKSLCRPTSSERCCLFANKVISSPFTLLLSGWWMSALFLLLNERMELESASGFVQQVCQHPFPQLEL
jgi:hypothetical protein